MGGIITVFAESMEIPERTELYSSLRDPWPGGISQHFISCHLHNQSIVKSVLSG